MLKLQDLAPFDENMTIKEVKEKIKQEYPYICPKCKGRGQVYVEDSFGDGRTGNYWIRCDICKGYGRTEKEIKPVYQIIRYE